MQVNFNDTIPSGARLVAHIADKGKMPEKLDAAFLDGAKTSRFKGNAGQVFEGFVSHDGSVLRIALAGAGDPAAQCRLNNLEKAGGALAAKFMTSGETAIAIDFASSGLDAQGAASVLLGLRLRSWRHDAYRTTMKEEQKISLKSVTAVGGPEGIENAWVDAEAVAELAA